MWREVFPVHRGRFRPGFFWFLARGLINLLAGAFLLVLYRLNQSSTPAWYPFYNSLLTIWFLGTLWLWWLSLRNIFRYTRLLERLLGRNPFQNEQTPRMLAAGALQGELEWSPDPDFYDKQTEFFHNWRLLADVLSAILLLPPRLLVYLARKITRR